MESAAMGSSRFAGGRKSAAVCGSRQGDAATGQADFQTYCARCHGVSGRGCACRRQRIGDPDRTDDPGGAGDRPNFLALISDQSLRSTILAGRPDEGMPDWRGFAAQPLTDRQVTDIVAWLGSKRQSFPGRRAQKAPSARARRIRVRKVPASVQKLGFRRMAQA